MMIRPTMGLRLTKHILMPEAAAAVCLLRQCDKRAASHEVEAIAVDQKRTGWGGRRGGRA